MRAGWRRTRSPRANLAPQLRCTFGAYNYSQIASSDDRMPLHGAARRTRRAGRFWGFWGYWRRRKDSGCVSNLSGDRVQRCASPDALYESTARVFGDSSTHGVPSVRGATTRNQAGKRAALLPIAQTRALGDTVPLIRSRGLRAYRVSRRGRATGAHEANFVCC